MWLFSVSDHKTFVLPHTTFGILGALSGHALGTNSSPELLAVLFRLPHVVLWTWLNTFVFDLANQRLPDAVAEDRINKPWRPVAAGRISMLQTRRLLLFVMPLSLIAIYICLGSAEETALLFLLTWMYNDLNGGEEHFVIRNLNIAVAYGVYANGALRVASKLDEPWFSRKAHLWEVMISAVVFTTVQVQDLKDQEGDRARERLTAPLMIGDSSTRWTIATPILIFSVACPLFWSLSLSAATSMGLMGLGVVIAVRLLTLRSQDADRQTWKLWSYWLVILYALPLAQNPRVFGALFQSLGQNA